MYKYKHEKNGQNNWRRLKRIAICVFEKLLGWTVLKVNFVCLLWMIITAMQETKKGWIFLLILVRHASDNQGVVLFWSKLVEGMIDWLSHHELYWKHITNPSWIRWHQAIRWLQMYFWIGDIELTTIFRPLLVFYRLQRQNSNGE